MIVHMCDYPGCKERAGFSVQYAEDQVPADTCMAHVGWPIATQTQSTGEASAVVKIIDWQRDRSG